MMAIAVLVALSAIYLTTLVLADCDTLLMRCFTNSWQTCGTFGAVGSLTLADCGRAHQLCIATKFENARSQAQSNSTASDVERYTNKFEHSTGCGSELKQCLETGDPAKNSEEYGVTAGICRHSFEQCTRVEIESAQSLVELGQNTLDAERSASRSEATAAECIDQLAGCLVITYTKCSELKLACPTAEADCYYRHGLCKSGENESDDKSHVELNRSTAEFMRNVESLRASARCVSPRKRCIRTMTIFGKVLQLHCSALRGDCLRLENECPVNPIEIARSQPESSLDTSEVERNANSLARPTEIVRSQPESSLDTSEVERNANSPARPTVPETHSGSGKISGGLQLLQMIALLSSGSPADLPSSLEPAISCGDVFECLVKIFVI